MKISELITENKALRRLLWIRHGCPFSALYGDDGEMQCGKCVIDFKRTSVELIEKRFIKINEPAIKAFFANKKKSTQIKSSKVKNFQEGDIKYGRKHM